MSCANSSKVVSSSFKNDKSEGVRGLLEHVEILGAHIQNIKAPEILSISSPENAIEALKEIQKLRCKIQSYQRTAQTLRAELEKTLH